VFSAASLTPTGKLSLRQIKRLGGVAGSLEERVAARCGRKPGLPMSAMAALKRINRRSNKMPVILGGATRVSARNMKKISQKK
jgi:hypothetical protein